MLRKTSNSSAINNQSQGTGQDNRPPYFRNLPIHEFEKVVAQTAYSKPFTMHYAVRSQAFNSVKGEGAYLRITTMY